MTEQEYVVLVEGKEQDVGDEWSVDSVGDFFDLVTGYAFKSSDFSDDGISVIKIKNIKAGHFSKHQFSYVSPTFLYTQSEKIALADDLLISMSGNRHDGSPETWVGKVALFHEEDTYFINQRVGALRLKKTTCLDARFASFLLSSYPYQELFIFIATSSGGQANLSPKQILGAPVRYPKIGEQRAIAHILGTLDDKIELNRRMNETLEEMARALFKSWFVDFDPVRAKMEGRDTGLPPDVADLFPDRLVESELGEIPERWEVKALGELIELAYGKALKADDRKSGSIPVYGSNGQVGWHDKKLAAGPGIVVGRKGNPGIVTWAHSDFFPIDTTFYVVPRNTEGDLPFLFFALTTQDLPSIAADSAVPGLNRNLAYMNRQLVPDKQVIDEFNHYAIEIFTRRHRLEEESRTLAALRDALLPKLMSGELWVRDAKQFTRRTI